jgi:hypothetical protein
MRPALFALILALMNLALCVTAPVYASPGAPIPSVATHPSEEVRLKALFAALDLNAPGLERVRDLHQRGAYQAAGRALLAYYRNSANASWIRADYTLHAPDSDDDAVVAARARDALQDTFTFQGVTGTAPRLANGRLDWDHRGPRNDREWALFFNRHFLFLPLVQKYQATRDPALARYANASMRDWVLSRAVEDKPVERDITPAWQPMSSASRLLQAWPHVFFGFINAPEFTDEARLLMLSSIPEQSAHLMKHHRKRHNHTIKEMTGLAHAAAVWPEFKDAAKWRAYAIETLKGELDRQFYADGVHQELSAHYHRSALQYYVWLKDFEAASGRELPPAFAEAVERAGDYLAQSMNPQGFGPLNNNGDLDDNRARILDFATRFRREDWRFIATNGAQGAAPDTMSRLYPWAGQVFLRNGFDRNAHFAMFDIGPWGAAHQHNDKLNLTLSAFGRELLVDGGRYRYEAADPYVAYLRSTAGHNTLLVDEKNQNADVRIVETPLVNAFYTHPSLDVAHGAFAAGYAGLEGQARHERTLIYVRNSYWLVIDRIVTDRPRRITAHWRFSPDATVIAQGVEAVSTDAGKGNLRITPIGATPFQLELIRGQEAPEPMGWHSPDYNIRLPSTVARYEGDISGPQAFAWLLSPAKDAPAPVRIRLERTTDTEMRVRIGADRFWIIFRADVAPSVRFERRGQAPVLIE